MKVAKTEAERERKKAMRIVWRWFNRAGLKFIRKQLRSRQAPPSSSETER